MVDAYEYLCEHLTPQGLPVLSKHEWAYLNTHCPKHSIKTAIIDCIMKHQAPFPFRNISIEDMETTFRKFHNADPDQWIIHDKNAAVEKFDDYTYSFKTYGLFTIQLGHTFNDVSNFFMQHERFNCAGYNIPSPLSIWNDRNKLEKLNWTLWRMNGTDLTIGEYRGMFRLGSYVATQFKPHVAKTIYHITGASKILDMSCGWGDRLAAFYASPQATLYVGCDPNDRTFNIYKDMCAKYEQLLTGISPRMTSSTTHFECHGKKSVIIYLSGSESVNLNHLDNDFDCLFTSPPYFSTERYNEGGDTEHMQSWKRYPEYHQWRDDFLFRSLDNFIPKLHGTGVTIINLIDPVIKGTRYRICDEMIAHITSIGHHFIGQIGMRIKQRPKKTANLLSFMGKHYIENMWCFSKDKNFTFSHVNNDLRRFFL